jgi:hypothetical protein
MITKPKSNSVITHALDGSHLTFMVQDAGNVVLDMDKLSDAVKRRATVHGMIQRISDAAALSRDSVTGKSASAADKLAAMRELVEHYSTGTAEWRRTSERSPRALGDVGLLIAALMAQDTARDEEKVRAKVKTFTKAQIAALLNHADVKPFADAIRSAGTAGVNAEELLAGI